MPNCEGYFLTGPKGKQAVQEFWQGAMDAGIKGVKLEIVEVEQVGDTAYEISRYTLFGADGQMLDRGKYIIIWKRVNDAWRIHRDIYNSSLPAAR